MDLLAPGHIVVMLLSLGVLLAAARVFGELARRLHQPSVLGEIFAGVVLGPTLLGYLHPGLFAYLFPDSGPGAVVMDGLVTLALVLFLLVAGMEVDLSTIWRQGRAAMSIGLAGIVFPFTLGFAAAWLAPQALGDTARHSLLVFALFFAAAMSISALPVIAKLLMDMNLYRSDMGMILIASAIFNDVIGWMVFALVLGMMGVAGHTFGIGPTIWLTLGYAAVVLTLGRWLIDRALPWVQAHTSWPGGVLGLALSLALVGAAFTEWIGVHAIFGAFIMGVAIGDSRHLREQTRTTINHFVSFIFAPLFFASIGLRTNFLAHFDLPLTLTVLLIACVGKVLGCRVGGWFGRMNRRESWAIGFGMNARGAMEIVLGLLALQAGLIDERLFVALVVMALATSMMSGPIMQRILRLKRPRRIADYLSAGSFHSPLPADTRDQAIARLVQAVTADMPPERSESFTAAVCAREQLMSTGLGHGVAVPHARIDGLTKPLVAVGLSRGGIDFNAPDGRPAHVIVLLLTGRDDAGAQIELLADVARTFGRFEDVERALEVESYTEFLVVLKVAKSTNQE